MQIKREAVILREEELILTNQRALYWQAQQMLVLSDIHIGKTAHFRKSGIAIPDQVLFKDLERLDDLINYFNPKTIMIVGDLFHAEVNEDVYTFQNWMKTHQAIKLILIKGNHDQSNFELYESLNIEIYNNQMALKPFIFTHDIKKITDEDFYISGHTHPGVSIKGKGKQRIKLPCYQVTKQQLILPAFSLFTGLNTKNEPEMCVSYAFTDSSIFKL